MHPALRWTDTIAEWFAVARQAAFPDTALPDLYLALLLYPLTGDERAMFAATYRLPASETRLLADITLVRERLETLLAEAEHPEQRIADSAIDRALHGIGTAALRAAQIAEPHTAARAIQRYIDHLRGVRLAVDGKFIESLGLRPGPRFGELLAGLRAAYLDGIVTTREDQEAWIRQAVAIEYMGDIRRGG
jgi:tRNA nucleotidyltransferase (CCA-adding enzyme)